MKTRLLIFSQSLDWLNDFDVPPFLSIYSYYLLALWVVYSLNPIYPMNCPINEVFGFPLTIFPSVFLFTRLLFVIKIRWPIHFFLLFLIILQIQLCELILLNILIDSISDLTSVGFHFFYYELFSCLSKIVYLFNSMLLIIINFISNWCMLHISILIISL